MLVSRNYKLKLAQGGETMDRRSPIVGFNMKDFKHMIGSAKTNQSSIEQLTLDDVKNNIDKCISKLINV